MIDYSALRKLKLPALAGLAVLLAVGGYYLFLTTKRTAYLNASNLRLLTTIGHHVEDWVGRQRNIFKILVTADNPTELLEAWNSPIPQWKFAPVKKGRDPRSIEDAIKPPSMRTDANGKLWLDLASDGGDWHTVEFNSPVLESLPTDVFDIVILATPDGKILKRAGNADLYLTDLNSLVTPPKTFAAEASRTTNLTVDISGTRYHLFIQPCCGRLQVGGATRPGLIVAGLVPASEFTERRFSISFSSLLLIAGVLLMIVVSWPFMKLALIGTRQRVALLDVLLLGISSLLVLAVGTLYVLDIYAYAKLKAHVDRGLQAFSTKIQENLRNEIAAAYSQLDALQSAAHAPAVQDAGVEAKGRAGALVLVEALTRHPDPDFSYYPFFESFNLIDSDGMQQRKWTIRRTSRPPIPVREREYFQQLREKRGWRIAECSGLNREGSFSLESIRSMTTMETQAALAVPTEPPIEKYPFASLAFPMISLIKPVVPPGFGFAVIEDRDNGKVLFHSDDRRNLIEQFFLETNLDRRLRSVVAARRAEFLDLQYWGRDSRAYVAPLKGFPWSLVTYFDKDLVRSVNVDWIVTTLLFLILYMSACAAVCVFVLIRPTRRATWLWPMPGGQAAYLELGALYLVVILVFGGAIYAAGRGDTLGRATESLLLFPAFGIPPLVWLLTYFHLRKARRAAHELKKREGASADPAAPEEDAQSNELLTLAYMGAAALLLVITAVMPTMAFFKLAHSVQVVPFIKYSQLKISSGLADRRQRVEKEAASLSDRTRAVNLSSSGEAPSDVVKRRSEIAGTQLQISDRAGHKRWLPAVDIYHESFETTVFRLPAPARPPKRTNDLMPEFLEPLLPFYSELSVATRELLHDKSDDDTRYWRRAPGNRVVLTNKAYRDGALEISSIVPAFGSLPSFFEDGKRLELLELLAVFAGIGVLALAIVIFAARRVFLLDMPFRFPASGSFQASGKSVFVVCRRTDLRDAYLATRGGAMVDLASLARRDAPPDAWDRALADQEKVLSGEPILLDHFEAGSADGELDAKKLLFIEQLVTVRHRKVAILSAIGPIPLRRAAPAGEPESGPKADTGPSMEQRWASLLTSSFVVIDLDPRFETDADDIPASRPPGRITKSAQQLGSWWLRVSHLATYVRNRQYQEIKGVLEAESASNPYLSPIRDDLKRMIRRRELEGIDREEVLGDFEERASNYYEGLWACCAPVEKLVLEHLAEDGFANYRDAKVVRRLVARGLLRRDPHLRLMNETFRRFVLSTHCRSEVVAVEQETQASAWDHFKRPFGAVLALVLVLFVTTQKARFDAMMALIVGMTGVLPSLLKLVGLLVGERPPLPVKPTEA